MGTSKHQHLREEEVVVRRHAVATSARMGLAAAAVVVLLGLLPLLTRDLVAVLGDPSIRDAAPAMFRLLAGLGSFVAAKWPLLAGAVAALLIAFEEHARATEGHMLEWLEARLFAVCAVAAGMLAVTDASAVTLWVMM
ncbi:MAG: hypothetical protein ABSD48_09975 [Armatimonadota bacterium]